ncbi:hypothetical protein HAX54_010734 [Datura stramonium]|uniref:Uncharacterized protein n=1 Tax=Datura stramonium TaxID=4076 RepID=A0ABS8TJJ5_DATST|nr:hypothetical protein [Datura stramonium]
MSNAQPSQHLFQLELGPSSFSHFTPPSGFHLGSRLVFVQHPSQHPSLQYPSHAFQLPPCHHPLLLQFLQGLSCLWNPSLKLKTFCSLFFAGSLNGEDGAAFAFSMILADLLGVLTSSPNQTPLLRTTRV